MISLPISSMFICLWMLIVVIRSDVIANHYTQQPRYTGKFIASFNAEEYKADSILACLPFCGPFCTCFGYQQSTKRCRVFDFCLDRNESFIEDGWLYYTSPSECVEGWVTYGGHDYMLNSAKLSQPEAMTVCHKCGAYLVEIEDAEENDWITQTLLKDIYCTFKYDCTTWIGGKDRETEGNFTWETSNTPFIYVNWDGINPDNKHDFSKPIDCVDMFYDGQWNDRPCNFQASFICER